MFANQTNSSGFGGSFGGGGKRQSTTSLFGSSKDQGQQQPSANNSGLFAPSATTNASQSGSTAGIFGATMPAASTTTPAGTISGGGLFGQTTRPATTANTGTSIFGGGSAGSTAQKPSAFGSTFGSTGGGGLLGAQGSASASTFGQQAPATQMQTSAAQLQLGTKYNDLPEDMQKKLDEFNKLVSDQMHLSESLDVSFTNDMIVQVDDELKTVHEIYNGVRNGIDRDGHFVTSLRSRVGKEFDLFEMAERSHDIMMKHGGPGSIGIAERPFYHPDDGIFKYFSEVVSQLESKYSHYSATLDDMERSVVPSSVRSGRVSSMISDVLKNNYNCFVGVASTVAVLEDEVRNEKSRFVKWRRAVLNQDGDPFPEPESKKHGPSSAQVKANRKTAKLSDLAKRVTVQGGSNPSTTTTVTNAPTTGKPAFGFSTPVPSSTSKPAATTSNLFGSTQPAQPSSSPSLFGSTAATTKPAASSSLFGSTPAAAQPASSSGLFGSTQQSGASVSAPQFGTKPPASTGTPSLFGSTPAANPQTTNTGQGGFGTAFGGAAAGNDATKSTPTFSFGAK